MSAGAGHPGNAILHIPHASTVIPEAIRDQFVIPDDELALELARLTDHFTDELFWYPSFHTVPVRFPVSRFVVDPERFEDDAREPMARRGHGVIYESGTQLQRIRRELAPREREVLLDAWYRPHHAALEARVAESIEARGGALVIDCHSFPDDPLPVDLDQASPRPDICLGTDAFHTPPELLACVREYFEHYGFTVEVDRPYAGALVPASRYRTDDRVQALMIEVNRRLYMERDGAEIRKAESFVEVAEHVQNAVQRAHAQATGSRVSFGHLSPETRAALSGRTFVTGTSGRGVRADGGGADGTTNEGGAG